MTRLTRSSEQGHEAIYQAQQEAAGAVRSGITVTLSILALSERIFVPFLLVALRIPRFTNFFFFKDPTLPQAGALSHM